MAKHVNERPNHTRPKMVEIKLRGKQSSLLSQARIDWLEAEILRLELAALLLHGDNSDYSVIAIPYEEQWRGLYEQNTAYILKRIQDALGKENIIATKANIKECLARITRRFEAHHKEDAFTVRQFTPFSMTYWYEKSKADPAHFQLTPPKKRKKKA